MKGQGGKVIDTCEGCTRQAEGHCKLYRDAKAISKFGGCPARHVKNKETTKSVFVNPIKRSKSMGGRK